MLFQLEWISVVMDVTGLLATFILFACVEGGKGPDVHKACVEGDTIGIPFKYASGPSMNILTNILAIVSLTIAPFLVM